MDAEYSREWRRRDGEAQRRAKRRSRAAARARFQLVAEHRAEYERLLAEELKKEAAS